MKDLTMFGVCCLVLSGLFWLLSIAFEGYEDSVRTSVVETLSNYECEKRDVR